MSNRRYTEEFRINAARLVVESGHSYSKAASRIGIAAQIPDWERCV